MISPRPTRNTPPYHVIQNDLSYHSCHSNSTNSNSKTSQCEMLHKPCFSATKQVRFFITHKIVVGHVSQTTLLVLLYSQQHFILNLTHCNSHLFGFYITNISIRYFIIVSQLSYDTYMSFQSRPKPPCKLQLGTRWRDYVSWQFSTPPRTSSSCHTCNI